MAALLVAMGVMAILMTAVMPVWKQMARREKEAELVFRGQQYMRAIRLFQQKTGPGVLPPSLDVLVDQHFLRQKYKDPVSGEDFLLIPGAVAAGAQAQLQAAQSANQSIGLPNRSQTPAASPYVAQGGPFGSNVPGGVVGVVSKSTETSIRIYNGHSKYNEWEFRYVAPPTPQQGSPDGRGAPQRGQPQGGPGAGRDGRGFSTGTPPGPGGRGGREFILGPDGRPVEVPPGTRGANPPGGRTGTPVSPPNPGPPRGSIPGR